MSDPTPHPRIFPERYWLEGAQTPEDVRRMFWPRLADLMRFNGGQRLPRRAASIVDTPYGAQVCARFDVPDNYERGPAYMPGYRPIRRVGDFVVQTLLYNWSLGRWEEEGHRLYALDETTALALLYTRYDAYPVADFRLPVPAFYLLLPPALGWQINLPAHRRTVNPATGQVSPPQPVEGVLVTGEYDAEGRLEAIRLLVGAHAPPRHADDTLYWQVDLARYTTVGEAMREALRETDTFNDARGRYEGTVPTIAADEVGIPREELLTLVMGAALYIQSAHPTLHARPPVPRPTAKRKGKHKRAWRTYDESTRYTVTYVGHPDTAFRKAAATRTTGRGELTRLPPRPHLRAGHMHRYWYGSGTERHAVPKWLPPIEVGTWDRRITYETIRELRLVERRTRPAQLEGATS